MITKPFPESRAAKMFVLLFLILMMASTVCGQTERRKPKTIRSVDFLNREYSAECAEQRVKVVNGKYAPPSGADGPYYELHVKVIYGDLTGDGQEEAVVTRICDGAAGSAEDAVIYSFNGGRLTTLATLESGNRGDGGDINLKIVRGLLIVERNVGQAACCAELRETIKYKLTGRRLLKVGQAVRKPLEPESKPRIERIEFASGRRAAAVEGTLEPDKRAEYQLRANRGQRLSVKLDVLEGDAALVVTSGNGQVVGAQRAYGVEWQGVLPATGEYKIIVNNQDVTSPPRQARYKLEVTIR